MDISILTITQMHTVKSDLVEIQTVDFMRRYRKHVIVIILVVAIIITPTSDVFTLSLVALPMWVLYEISILIVKTNRR